MKRLAQALKPQTLNVKLGPMKPSTSRFHDINGLRYHVRTWGDPDDPRLFLFHGWMDVSASFQFLVDQLEYDWFVVAPDWRGFGLTAWAPGGYWFPDYYADLDALLALYAPHTPASLVGHSMGGNIVLTYAGIRPGRVSHIVTLEGLGLARAQPQQAPDRYARWLDELNHPPQFRRYASFEELAGRLKRNNRRLTDAQAAYLAAHWAHRVAGGTVVLRSDPAHKRVNPYVFRLEEWLACWRRITAPVLLVTGKDSHSREGVRDSAEQLAERMEAVPDLREIALDDCGHMIHHDKPERLARVIEDFLG
jgi:pimeloyl-ACP methyl ester carboxylesterase